MNDERVVAHPERLILTRLFLVQRRLRWTRSLIAGLRWFAAGSGIAALILLALWNWNKLPGPWQWLADAGRPREVLWLPGLIALGGFAATFFEMPSPRRAAFRMDRSLDSRELLLTAVDWILSEKPRTPTSEKLLQQAAELVKDEEEFARRMQGLEPVPRRLQALLASFAVPLCMALYLPRQNLLPPSSAMWMGDNQVDQLTEDLLKELDDTGDLHKTQEKLEKLLQQMNEPKTEGKPDDDRQVTQRELQRVSDQLQQQAEAREKARELLEALSQRARQKMEMSEQDRDALKALKEKLADPAQKDRLEQAASNWDKENFDQASQELESLQREMGESAQSLSEQAQKTAAQGEMKGDSGQEFNDAQGDGFNPDGTPKDQDGKGEGQGQGQGKGKGKGSKPGEGEIAQGEGNGPAPGKGTTLDEQKDPAPADGTRSLRRGKQQSEWMEEYQYLHPPERTDFEKSQTRVQGQMGDNGPRFHTKKEGLGQATEPAQTDGSGGLLEYREEAENAILREEVPADYRDNVRMYFESLDQKR